MVQVIIDMPNGEVRSLALNETGTGRWQLHINEGLGKVPLVTHEYGAWGPAIAAARNHYERWTAFGGVERQ